MDAISGLHINNCKEEKLYTASIVEDESAIRTYLQDTLSKSFKMNHMPMKIETFQSGTCFLENSNGHCHYDIVFMDIEMPEIDGIEVCRQLKSSNPDIIVVFISAKEELVFQSFEVQPFRFIRKSQYENQLQALTRSCIDLLHKKNSKVIKFEENYSGDLYSFHVDDIVYVEAFGKKSTVVTKTDSVVIKNMLMSFEKTLENYAFVKPHRSYLVNCKYIKYIGKQYMRLTNSVEIPISRDRSEAVKQQFLNYSIN